uniref:Protein kinase domain-containing protein n=1 Tax=Ananas comosus var. bracteatus TaxID=296719 RepID=A0A6V7QL88_ANACO|nr:unnamed protein product [Ananas comosus var. bracteatus]
MSEELRREYEIGEEIGRGRFGWGGGVRAVYEDEGWIHVVMELCEGPDLFDWIRERRGEPATEPEAAAVVAQIAAALAACHRRGVAHRDVKPDNILLDGGGRRARLADFGSPRASSRRGRGGDGGAGGDAVLRGAGGGGGDGVRGEGGRVEPRGGDVRDAHRRRRGAVRGDTAEEIFAAVRRGNLRFPTRLFAGVSSGAKDLMRRMMCKDPSRRFSAEQVLRHPWITSGRGLSENAI